MFNKVKLSGRQVLLVGLMVALLLVIKAEAAVICPSDACQFTGSGVVRVSINSDSNAGVRLDLGGTPQWSVATVSGGDFQIFDETGSVNRLYIKTDTGNIGIGTTSPGAALHVVHTSANSPIQAERGPTSSTTPSVFGINNGSGAGVAGQASANDSGSAGVLGRHNGGRPGVFGCSPCPLRAFPGTPAGDIGVAGFTTGGTAVLGQASAGGKLFVGESPSGTVRFSVDGAGNLMATGTKSFVQAHPTDLSKQIVYVSLEGPEAGTYIRGTAQLINGEVVIELPEHFSLVTNNEGLTVQLTPRGEWLQLYLVKASTQQIIVREASGKNGQFDYLVQGVRKGFENHQVIQEKGG